MTHPLRNRRSLLLLAVASALFVAAGCGTTSDAKRADCARARQIYEAYVEAVAAGLPQDEKAVAAAKIAAAVIAVYCATDDPWFDVNGVRVLTLP